MKKEYCLYCHTNKINGKKYFGITCQKPQRRWQNGNGYKTKYFYNAIEKYGWNNFIHEVLIENLSFDEAKKLEIEYIKKYHTCIYDNECWGYNTFFKILRFLFLCHRPPGTVSRWAVAFGKER